MDLESKWIMAIKEDELPEGEKRALLLEGNKVLLLKRKVSFLPCPTNVLIWNVRCRKVIWTST